MSIDRDRVVYKLGTAASDPVCSARPRRPGAASRATGQPRNRNEATSDGLDYRPPAVAPGRRRITRGALPRAVSGACPDPDAAARGVGLRRVVAGLSGTPCRGPGPRLICLLAPGLRPVRTLLQNGRAPGRGRGG